MIGTNATPKRTPKALAAVHRWPLWARATLAFVLAPVAAWLVSMLLNALGGPGGNMWVFFAGFWIMLLAAFVPALVLDVDPEPIGVVWFVAIVGWWAIVQVAHIIVASGL
jgi:hypothetical protein